MSPLVTTASPPTPVRNRLGSQACHQCHHCHHYFSAYARAGRKLSKGTTGDGVTLVTAAAAPRLSKADIRRAGTCRRCVGVTPAPPRPEPTCKVAWARARATSHPGSRGAILPDSVGNRSGSEHLTRERYPYRSEGRFT